MSRKRDSLLYKKDINTLDEALEYIEKLKTRIRKVTKERNKLKSENKTLSAAQAKNDWYLEEVTNGIPLSDLIKYTKLGEQLKLDGEPCPKCKKKTVKKLLFSGFHIALCESCDYRERINEAASEEDE